MGEVLQSVMPEWDAHRWCRLRMSSRCATRCAARSCPPDIRSCELAALDQVILGHVRLHLELCGRCSAARPAVDRLLDIACGRMQGMGKKGELQAFTAWLCSFVRNWQILSCRPLFAAFRSAASAHSGRSVLAYTVDELTNIAPQQHAIQMSLPSYTRESPHGRIMLCPVTGLHNV